MGKTIKQTLIDERGNMLVTVQWGSRLFVVEIGAEGVVVAPANTDGSISREACPSVWVDTNQIMNSDAYEVDEATAPLLVQSYFNNEQETPVTVELTKDKAVIGGDGFQFAKLKEYCFQHLSDMKDE